MQLFDFFYYLKIIFLISQGDNNWVFHYRLKILEDLGFGIKRDKKFLKLIIPSWRPDISQGVDIVEELVRITGYDKIKTVNPIKERTKLTLTKSQKLFHFSPFFIYSNE